MNASRLPGCPYKNGRKFVKQSAHYENLHVFAGLDTGGAPMFYDLRYVVAHQQAETAELRKYLEDMAKVVIDLRADNDELRKKLEQREINEWMASLEA